MNNKVPQQINDIVGDNVKKLAQLFPSVVKDGEVDFEALKEELGQYEEVGSEKYELTWAGKKNAKKDCSGRCYWKNTKIYSRG
ncbi:hypothetical protein BACPEC_01221 [[Bacteroides] pectinophilus ATCC 43243]|uniref:Uncharacterized protein n=1 Tax=[Bacteroides] pectinophilus ATCC 43243 TaxID=483218 RepID=B7ARB1_9FIRM|nr:hypothetical protein BACPEC_01221 [[Bacteroides] pectinophilus ATCC 43243]